MVTKLFLALLLIKNSLSLIPIQCSANATNNKICCPVLPYYGTPCGFPIRGRCEQVRHPNEFFPSVLRIDDRAYWPSRFFQYLCSCNANFFGIACEECRPGFMGPKCQRRKVVVRRNIRSLSQRERMILNSVIVSALHTRSGYVIPTELDNGLSDPIINPTWIDASIQYKKVFDHKFASRTTLFTSTNDCKNLGKLLDFNHNAVGFLTWHRYMMMDWERRLQEIAMRRFGIVDFGLPYWDWTDLIGCDICTDDLVGDVGDLEPIGRRISPHSPFYNWTEFCMEPTVTTGCYGCHKSGRLGLLTRSWNSVNFPTLQDVSFTLRQPRFYAEQSDLCNSLHKALEGSCGISYSSDKSDFMHNRIHNMIDGSMCCSATSVNDPLFIFHHIQIDRIFQAWYLIHRPKITDFPERGESPGHGRDSFLVGFLPLITHGELFTDTRNLGYVYDSYDFSVNNKHKD